MSYSCVTLFRKGTPNARNAASFLQKHQDTVMYLDSESASLLKVKFKKKKKNNKMRRLTDLFGKERVGKEQFCCCSSGWRAQRVFDSHVRCLFCFLLFVCLVLTTSVCRFRPGQGWVEVGEAQAKDRSLGTAKMTPMEARKKAMAQKRLDVLRKL
jgi:hypothetical protein